jgi:diguanylate cyclase (GGDEF)-like protein
VRPGGVVAVVVVDLDHLKQVNDALGHRTGDALIRATARRLRSGLAVGGVAARVGGDEFVLVEPHPSAEHADRRVHRLRRDLALTVEVGGVAVPAGASVGLAVSGRDGDAFADLLAVADQRMYARKTGGASPAPLALPGRVVPSGADHAADLARDLAAAIGAPERGELRLHHQPQIAPDGGVVGFEALLRWEHPELGPLAPAGFLPIAEREGLAATLDGLAIRLALADHAVLAELVPWATTSVNLSAHSLLSPDLPARLRSLLASYDVPAEQLVLEISESASGLGLRVEGLAAELRDVGCSLSVQELGTPRTSLASVGPDALAAEIKIHPRLVAAVESDPAALRSVRGLTSAAHGVGTRVVAEGVETEAQATLVADLGCDVLQGFWVAPPMSLLDAVDWTRFWLRSGRRPLPTASGRSA